MRIERYYSSVKEEASRLTDDALTLLDAEDYVGFFKACGPNYTRGIRRAQEITAVFKFSSSSRETATQFAASLKVTKKKLFSKKKNKIEASFTAKNKFKESTNSLQITIQGFGLGLSQEGSDTLVATSMDQYTEVMKFAFNTMTKAEDAHHIGMVYGIEVVPWVNNVVFQVAAKMQDENIVVPLPRTLIPKAYKNNNPEDTAGFENTEAIRLTFDCKESSFDIDQFGYCCEPEALFNRTSREYELGDPDQKICKPVRQLDRSLLKDNMSNNGEFVARLGSAIRYRLTQLSVTEKCISAANAMPDRFDFHYIKPQDSVKYDRAIDTKMTLFDLKQTLDPFGDYSIIKHMGKELDEWIEMFYSPCFAALYGTNIANTPDTDISFFMAYPWHAHKECMHLSCLANNMRWDRKDGGCTPSLTTKATSSAYGTPETQCASNPEENGVEETCKYTHSDLHAYHTDVNNCWGKRSSDTVSNSPADYILEQFCNPQLTGEKITDQSTIDQMKTDKLTCVNSATTV